MAPNCGPSGASKTTICAPTADSWVAAPRWPELEDVSACPRRELAANPVTVDRPCHVVTFSFTQTAEGSNGSLIAIPPPGRPLAVAVNSFSRLVVTYEEALERCTGLARTPAESRR
jgi:hypothetical protein